MQKSLEGVAKLASTTTHYRENLDFFSGCMTQDSQHKIRNAFSFVERNYTDSSATCFGKISSLSQDGLTCMFRLSRFYGLHSH